MKRCPDELLTGKNVEACHPAGEGHLLALKEGQGVRLELIGKKGVVWRRVLPGTVAYQEDFVVVIETPTLHRVLWLSPKDGSTTRTIDFFEQIGPPPDPKLFCVDRVLKWFKSKSGTVAASCLVLD